LNFEEDRQQEQEGKAGACPKQPITEGLHDGEKFVAMVDKSEENVGVILNQLVFLGHPPGHTLLRLSTPLNSA